MTDQTPTTRRAAAERILAAIAADPFADLDPADVAALAAPRLPDRSWEPFQIDAKTFRLGDRIEVMVLDGGLARGTFAGTIDVGLGTGILIDEEGTEVVYLAKEIKAARHYPAPGAVDWGWPSDDPDADAAAMAVWTR